MIDNTRNTQPGMMSMRKNLKLAPIGIKKGSVEDIIIINKHSFEKARIFYHVKNPQEIIGQINTHLYCDDRNLKTISSVRFYREGNNQEHLVSDLFNIKCMDKFRLRFRNYCDKEIKINSIYMMCSG